LLEELKQAKQKRHVLYVLLCRYNDKVKEIIKELKYLEENYNY